MVKPKGVTAYWVEISVTAQGVEAEQFKGRIVGDVDGLQMVEVVPLNGDEEGEVRKVSAASVCLLKEAADCYAVKRLQAIQEAITVSLKNAIRQFGGRA